MVLDGLWSSSMIKEQSRNLRDFEEDSLHVSCRVYYMDTMTDRFFVL